MTRVAARQLAQICRRAGTALKAGVDIRTVWDQESRRGPPAQREQMARISSRVAAGDTVADAMRDSGRFFPPLMCELLDVGERTGRLDAALLRLADHYDHALRLRRSVMLGIAWPLIELSLAVVVVGVLIWVSGWVTGMLPQRGAGQTVDLLGVGLIGTRGLVIYMLIVVAAAFVIGAPAVAVARGRVSPPAMRLAMRIPGLGRWLEVIALERLAWSLAMALESGIDAKRSIRLALRSTQNPFYISHLDEVERLVVQGSEFHESLRSTGAFPDEFLNTLETAEVAGTQSESLVNLSGEYQDRAKASAKAFTVVATFAAFGLMILIMVTLIFRIAFWIAMQYREAGQI